MRASRAAGKRGARRRSEVKERFWREHVAWQAAAGLTVRAYCRQHGLTEPSFYSWRQELARRAATIRNEAPPTVASTVRSRATSANASRRGASALTSPATSQKPAVFARLDLRPEPPLPHERIEIVLGDGAVVRVPRGVDEATLRAVLAAARARPC